MIPQRTSISNTTAFSNPRSLNRRLGFISSLLVFGILWVFFMWFILHRIVDHRHSISSSSSSSFLSTDEQQLVEDSNHDGFYNLEDDDNNDDDTTLNQGVYASEIDNDNNNNNENNENENENENKNNEENDENDEDNEGFLNVIMEMPYPWQSVLDYMDHHVHHGFFHSQHNNSSSSSSSLLSSTTSTRIKTSSKKENNQKNQGSQTKLNEGTKREIYLKGKRKEEYEEAVIRNIVHPAVKTLHVMWEDETGRRALERIQSVHDVNDKMRVRNNKWHSGRMRYSDALMYAANYIEEDEIVLITNADLYLSDGWQSLPPLMKQYQNRSKENMNYDSQNNENKNNENKNNENKNNENNDKRKHNKNEKGSNDKPILMALSRFGNEGCLNSDVSKCQEGLRLGSHDAFLFVNPVAESIAENLEHPQNIPGAENVVVYEFQRSGYRICNPCLRLKMIHNHCSSFRKYAGNRMNTHGRSAWAIPRSYFMISFFFSIMC